MLRTLACAAVALCLFAGSTLAGDDTAKAKKKKKGAKAVSGQIVKVDKEKGILTVSMKVKKELQEKEFKLTKDTKVAVMKGDEKTELKADKLADLLGKDEFKAGATVSIEVASKGDDTATAVTFTEGKKKKKKAKES